MPDTELPDLTAAEDISDDDLAYIVQGGTADRKATIAQLRGDPAARLVALDELSPLTDEDLIFVVRPDGSPLEYTAHRATIADLLALAPEGSGGAGLTPPVLSDFAWRNQGGATAVEANGGILMTAPNGTNNFRILEKAAPSTPYTITAYIEMMAYVQNSSANLGIGWNDGTKLVTLGAEWHNSGMNVSASKYSNVTTFSAHYVQRGIGARPAVWLRITDDGTDRVSSWSIDGINWLELHSVGRTDFLTPANIQLHVNNNLAAPILMNLRSWAQS